MEVREIDRNKVQGEVPWIPNTPLKPILQRPVPIYVPGEGIQMGSHSKEVSTCCESSTSAEIETRQHLWPSHEATVTNIACDRMKLTYDNNFGSGNNSFAELLAQATSATSIAGYEEILKNQFATGSSNNSFAELLAQAASATSIVAYEEILRNQFVPNLNTQINPNLFINSAHNNHQDPQGSSFFTYYGHNTTNVAPHITDNAAIAEITQDVNTHIDLNKTPQQKPRRKKHRPKVITEGKPRRNNKTNTQKADQSKGNPTSKRKYVRKKGPNTVSSPQVEATGESTKPLVPESAKKACRRSLNFEGDQQRDGNSTCRETVAATNTLTNEGRQALAASLAENNSHGAKPQLQAVGSSSVGSKRKHIEHEDTNPINLIGVQYNMLQNHYPESWLQFPNIQKKKRTEKGKNSNTCNTSAASATNTVQVAACPEDGRSSPCVSTSDFWPPNSEYNAVKVPVTIAATERVIHGTPPSICNFSLWQTMQTKRRSRLPARKTCVNAERQQTCIDALVADMGVTVTKKKRTKKRSTLVSSAYSCSLPMENLQVVAGEETWKNVHTADELTEVFRHLNINRESRELVLHGQNALVPYNQQHQKNKGAAHGYGTIIPYEGLFDPIKKQRPRPKVDLDEETNRVWKLLMLDINSPGIDGMDEAKAKWWEEERKVFRGRADSFIARMHLVQGIVSELKGYERYYTNHFTHKSNI
ncbi:hypothetical protein PIB30_019994 [Stylosanthes scabra]|uniref:Uncharacterized protein n=1 Tax=Stylosanthes scabra TaxID=79078 RepID=A0ABU6Z816_9FABA|nr:hypothetical protein [Stylosanthes scabra]